MLYDVLKGERCYGKSDRCCIENMLKAMDGMINVIKVVPKKCWKLRTLYQEW